MKEQRSKSFDQARKTAPFESILLQELEDFDFDKEYDIYMNCKSNDFTDASQSGEDDWIMNEIDRIISVDEAALEQMLEHKVKKYHRVQNKILNKLSWMVKICLNRSFYHQNLIRYFTFKIIEIQI